MEIILVKYVTDYLGPIQLFRLYPRSTLPPVPIGSIGCYRCIRRIDRILLPRIRYPIPPRGFSKHCRRRWIAPRQLPLRSQGNV